MGNKGDIRKEEIQPDLPKRWSIIPFKQGLKKSGRFTKLKSSQYLENGTFPVIDQGEKFISGYIDNNEFIYEGDLPVVIFGDHTRILKFIDFPFAAGADGTKILTALDSIDSKFFYYYLKSLKIPSFGYSRHYKVFDHLDIPIPPLPEQLRIVAKLDALFGHLDVLRAKLDRIPTLLKNFRQQVLTQAVAGELTKEWREGKGLEEWERVQLGKLGKWVGGGTPSKSEPAFWNNGEVLWITPKDMKSIFVSDSLDKITADAVEKSSTKLVPSNSILIVTRSGILRRILPISLNTKEATVNQDLKVLIPKKEVYPKFLLYSLIGLEENIRINCMKSGTTVESIEFSDLKGYSLGIPTFKEQEEIVRKVEALFSLADKIESQYASLKAKIDQLPQAILAKAFRGELVSQEVKEYVVEEIEGLMAAEKIGFYKSKK